MSRFVAGGQYHGGWSNARSRSRQMAAIGETTMAEKKKPAEQAEEPKFHPEYPFPAPPMTDKPWSDEQDDDEKAKVGKD